MGDAGKLSMCTLFQHDVAKNAVNSFVDCRDKKLNGRLEGRLAAGESITVASRGEGENGDYSIAWNLDVTTKVLARP